MLVICLGFCEVEAWDWVARALDEDLPLASFRGKFEAKTGCFEGFLRLFSANSLEGLKIV